MLQKAERLQHLPLSCQKLVDGDVAKRVAELLRECRVVADGAVEPEMPRKAQLLSKLYNCVCVCFNFAPDLPNQTAHWRKL